MYTDQHLLNQIWIFHHTLLSQNWLYIIYEYINKKLFIYIIIYLIAFCIFVAEKLKFKNSVN